MIGDIYLFIKQFLKETFCIHEYSRKSIDIQSWKECNVRNVEELNFRRKKLCRIGVKDI